MAGGTDEVKDIRDKARALGFRSMAASMQAVCCEQEATREVLARVMLEHVELTDQLKTMAAAQKSDRETLKVILAAMSKVAAKA
jgi:hypothetical protein